MIHRLVKLSFNAEETASFETIFKNSREHIRNMEGCLHLECWRDVNDHTIYYTYSRWIDEAALNAYRNSDFFQATWAKTKALFRARPEAFSAEQLSDLPIPPPEIKRILVDDYHLEIGPISDHHFRWLHQKAYAGWVILVDDLTRKYCLPRILPFLSHDRTVIIEVPAGERHKHLDTCRFIWEEMFRAGIGRRWCMLNLGGGVIGDMGGFAAATYKRGIDFVQIPTTLLSQVDASVGGKLGIDFYEIKNSVGLFQNPQAVWIDPAFLPTLSTREVRSGYAEIIKHALIADYAQWQSVKTTNALDQANWLQLIPDSVKIKRDIVEQDPHERGLRKALNFGHTIGHAVESYWLHTDHRLLHGEAIAVGMICETWLSVQLEQLAASALNEIVSYLLGLYGHQAIPEESFATQIDFMKQDKKNEDHRINFTLLKRIGEATVNVTVKSNLIQDALRFYNTLVKED
ncbi:MAG: 3-dehydroquinate synthase [Bacteroidota bacterium]